MPSELIAAELVTDDHTYRRTLHVVWGKPGGVPEAPAGWANQGFAQVQIREDHGRTGTTTGLTVGVEEIEHLIRVLRRARKGLQRQVLEELYPGGPAHRSNCVDGSVCGEPSGCPPNK